MCVVPAAADLTPNPTVVYPTKILEYMACRRPIVAPRRETVAQVVENNREALLFEPGDPVDLARKVLRLLGEPLLRDRLAQNAYERVRRDFTASGARRALRAAYDLLAERFDLKAVESDDDDMPKIDVLADDDFEATVFQEAPAPPPVDTALSKLEVLDDALVMLEVEPDATGSTSSGSVIAPPPPRSPDETVERAPVIRRRPTPAGGRCRRSPRRPRRRAPTTGRSPHLAAGTDADDGTPIEGRDRGRPGAAGQAASSWPARSTSRRRRRTACATSPAGSSCARAGSWARTAAIRTPARGPRRLSAGSWRRRIDRR